MTRLPGSSSSVVCILLCVAGCGRDSDGARASRPAVPSSAGSATVLATAPDDLRPPRGAASSGGSAFIFGERGAGVAFVGERSGKVQVIHNGRAGKEYLAVGAVALSPDGRRCAYGAHAAGKWRMVVDGVEAERAFDSLGEPVFSADGAHVAYAAMDGQRWHLVVDGRVNGGTRTRYLAQAFNADGSRIAFIDDVDERGLGRLVVSDLAFKRQTTAATGVNGMILSPDRTRVAAVVASGGGEGVVAFSFARPDLVERGRTYDGAHVLTFSPDGSSLAYLAERSGKGLVVMDDKEEPLPAGGVAGMPVIRPGRGVVGVLTVSGDSVVLREYFGKAGQGEVGHEEAEGLVYGGDGGSYAYAARKGERWFVVANGREGPSFDRVVTPQFSPDGKWLVYRARKDGRRFVVIANADGTTARQGPAYEQVHEVHFSTDGKSVAYGAKDGRQLIWKVEPL